MYFSYTKNHLIDEIHVFVQYFFKKDRIIQKKYAIFILSLTNKKLITHETKTSTLRMI
jgi:hypothetical protein